MKNKEELLKRLNDKEFSKLFSGANSTEDIIKIAKEQGYDITDEDVENSSLSDDMLENVAGGKGNAQQDIHLTTGGSGSITITDSFKQDPTVSPSTETKTTASFRG